MSQTKWYVKSKSIWAGVGLILYAILKFVLFGEQDIQAFLTGLGILGLRHAIEKKGGE